MDTSRAKRLTTVLGFLLAGAGIAWPTSIWSAHRRAAIRTRPGPGAPARRSGGAPTRSGRRPTDRIRIKRQDLGVAWSIDTKAGTYTEAPLGKAAAPASPADVEKLHNEGYDYEPVFDWKLEDTGLEEEVAGVRCRKHVLDGDADFSEKVIEFWTAADLGPSIPARRPDLGFFLGRTEAGAFSSAGRRSRAGFVLKERVVENPPSAGPSEERPSWRTAFTTL